MGDDGTDRFVPSDGRGVALWFQCVPEPEQIKDRLHLDLRLTGGPTLAHTAARRSGRRRGRASRGGDPIRWTEDDAVDHVAALTGDPGKAADAARHEERARHLAADDA